MKQWASQSLNHEGGVCARDQLGRLQEGECLSSLSIGFAKEILVRLISAAVVVAEEPRIIFYLSLTQHQRRYTPTRDGRCGVRLPDSQLPYLLLPDYATLRTRGAQYVCDYGTLEI